MSKKNYKTMTEQEFKHEFANELFDIFIEKELDAGMYPGKMRQASHTELLKYVGRRFLAIAEEIEHDFAADDAETIWTVIEQLKKEIAALKAK